MQQDNLSTIIVSVRTTHQIYNARVDIETESRKILANGKILKNHIIEKKLRDKIKMKGIGNVKHVEGSIRNIFANILPEFCKTSTF